MTTDSPTPNTEDDLSWLPASERKRWREEQMTRPKPAYYVIRCLGSN